MSRRRREEAKPGRWGLPSTLAGSDHLGRQLDRKRREAAKAARVEAAPAEDAPPPRERRTPPGPMPAPAATERWLAARGITPFAFQRDTWNHIAAGRSGLLHATTGAGKTYAAWLGALRFELARAERDGVPALRKLRILWITPMRALAADTTHALAESAAGIGLDWEIAMRTGDIDAATRARQSKHLPETLVTTPESLTVLLARTDAHALFDSVSVIVVDEWHELMGNKRGVQTQLAMARLWRWNPALVAWGLSATLGNLDTARQALLGLDKRGKPRRGVMVKGDTPKEIVIDTLIPDSIERFPWGGHLGIRLVDAVVAELEKSSTTLVFTNVRSQAEIWYQTLLAAKPEWAGIIALHHGSLDREVREWVEAGLKAGTLKAVVCTSSLDLGVDFLPVERVLQIGSAKGVARLLQRAGRSGHAPGRPSRATLVPTNALELVEAAAARRAVAARRVEPRLAPNKPLDCLVQHLVTIAVGTGFVADELFDEVKTAWSYRDLTRAEFDWALAFDEGGGASLAAYPDYQRIARDPARDPTGDTPDVYRVPRADLARRHRMSIGTITADTAMFVAWLATGGKLGQIEEGFIARMKPGDVFVFGGRVLELVRVRDMTAYVRKATRKHGRVPTWQGSRMALTSEMADASLDMLHRAAHASDAWFRREPEMKAVRPLLELQQRWSALPVTGRLVCELIASREGHHFVCYAFAGRLVHIGLGALLAWRAAREKPGTFSISMNDYGFELLSAEPFDWERLIAEGLFSTDRLLEDVIASLNASELAQRRFREIARVSGLVFAGYPGERKSSRNVQASSSLFYEVFRKHDAGNLLLTQAETEALEQELDIGRLRGTLERVATWDLCITRPAHATPFSFPLMIERFREEVSTEKLAERIARMLAELEAAAADTDLQTGRRRGYVKRVRTGK
ncbi:MAG: ligase-associated DNA damage response DEXH box helicase [Burkholderiaceae bacterium]